METLYGKYPKRITCECNVDGKNEELTTIHLNDRCPVCNRVHQVCVPTPLFKVKKIDEVEAEELQAA